MELQQPISNLSKKEKISEVYKCQKQINEFYEKLDKDYQDSIKFKTQKIIIIGQQSSGKSTTLQYFARIENYLPCKPGLGTKIPSRIVLFVEELKGYKNGVRIYREGHTEEQKFIYNGDDYLRISQKISELSFANDDKVDISSEYTLVIEFYNQDCNREIYDLPGTVNNDPRKRDLTNALIEKYKQNPDNLILYCYKTNEDPANINMGIDQLKKEDLKRYILIGTNVLEKQSTNYINTVYGKYKDKIKDFFLVAPDIPKYLQDYNVEDNNFEQLQEEHRQQFFSQTKEQLDQWRNRCYEKEEEVLEKQENQTNILKHILGLQL